MFAFRYKHGDNIPIDTRYLKTICENQREPTVMTMSPQPSKKIRLEENSKDSLFHFRNMSLGGDDQMSVDSKKNEFNMFLAGDAEKTVDIQHEMQKNIFTDGNMDISFNGEPQAGPSKMDFNFDNCSFVFPEKTEQNVSVRLNVVG